MLYKAVKKEYGYMVIGKGIKVFFHTILVGICAFFVGIWKAIIFIPIAWRKFWKQADRVVGNFARAILRHHTPIQKNKVFFFTQEFRYGCNPKYICEELLKQNLDIDVVWRVNKKITSGMPDNVRTVEAGSYEYYKEIFSSNVVVANSYIFLDQTLKLSKKQTLIQTWHGSLGIKKFGPKEMKHSGRRKYASILTGKMSTYCITNGSFVSGSLRRAYFSKTPMLEYGHPRNDIFFDGYKDKREQLRKDFCVKYNLPLNTKLVMYAPTFRDSDSFKCYDVDFDRLVMSLQERFDGNWVILLRYHPSLLKKYKKQAKTNENVSAKIIDVTNYVDMQELVAITDVAISDYSSWVYDFVLTRKPCFLFAVDINDYNTERGFCYPLETTPFPISTNNDELSKSIINFDEKKYAQDVENFLVDKGCIDDGHASERVVELIKQITGAKESKKATELSDEDSLEQRLKEKKESSSQIQYAWFVKGESKTEGRDIFTNRLQLKGNSRVVKLTLFLKSKDHIVITQNKLENGVYTNVNVLNYDNVSQSSLNNNVFVRGDKGEIVPIQDGAYSFELNIKDKSIKVGFKESPAPSPSVFIEGNFNKNANWNCCFKPSFKFENDDEVAVLENVYLKEGSCFYLVCKPSKEKAWSKSFAVNYNYLKPCIYAEKMTDNNPLIKVKQSGLYNIFINVYSNVINLEKVEL